MTVFRPGKQKFDNQREADAFAKDRRREGYKVTYDYHGYNGDVTVIWKYNTKPFGGLLQD